MNNYLFATLILLTAFISCSTNNEKLPIIGRFEIVNGDTLLHEIPDFTFMNQDSQKVSNQSLEPYLYVADFFFMSCPSICPKVKKQMLRIYDKYEDNEKIKLVSHTIDPVRDTPERLKLYARNLEVKNEKWIFLTGDKDSILEIAEDYFVAAYEDEDAPGGFDHSGKIILVDTERHVRAFAEGTDPDDVTKFLRDIDRLLKEYEPTE